MRGECEPALQWLERAYLQREGGLSLLKSDPMLGEAAWHARFTALVHRMNLPD
jgi:hypothetical protein